MLENSCNSLTFIPNHIIDEIRQRADIVQIISEHVLIKKSGKNFKGLCPFHTEKTPSFTVNPGKGIYHCFGCGAGGNIFKFLMETEGLSFTEAVCKLSNHYGIPIPENSLNSKESINAGEREFLIKLNLKAMEYFQQVLRDPLKGKVARSYLKSRSFDQVTWETYQLGWAPPGWEGLLKYFKNKHNISPAQLEKAGLVKRREVKHSANSYYDRFRGRIMFPLLDTYGNVSGFAGRLIEESDHEPKYLNSPETILYKKGHQLFGFYHAREHIRKHEQVLVVEGYFDQIRANQNAIRHAVATCGTALTTRQVSLLKNQTQNVVLIFDSDTAGESATDRGIETFLGQGIQISVLALPKGEDPDSYIQKHGKDIFLEKLRNVPSFLEYFLQKAKNQGPIDSLPRRLEIINSVLPILVKTSNAFEKREGFRLLVDELQIEDQDLLAELKKTFEKNKSFLRLEESKLTIRKNPEEYYLIQLILYDESIAEIIKKEVPIQMYQDPVYREIAGAFYSQLDKSEPIQANRVLDWLTSDGGKALLAKLSVSPVEFDDPLRAAEDCIRKVKVKELEGKIKALKQERRKADKAGEIERSHHLQQLVREMQGSLSQEIRMTG